MSKNYISDRTANNLAAKILGCNVAEGANIGHITTMKAFKETKPSLAAIIDETVASGVTKANVPVVA